MKPKYSIVTCISRPDVYEKCLLKSVNNCRKNHLIEFIPVFNEHNRYSASNALNIGIEVSRADYVILAHQDISLVSDWFTILDRLIEEAPDDQAIIGAAGISLAYGCDSIGRWGGALHTDTVAVGSVWESDLKLRESPYWDGTKTLTKVHCADECLLVLNKKTGLRFDSQFTGFHFYGVDLCLQARSAAYGVYCAHLPIIHYGSYSASFTGNSKYWSYLRFLFNKWRLRFPELLGTHMHWSHRSGIPELTSYINIALDSDDGVTLGIRSMGINKVKLSTDQRQGLIDQ